MIALLTGTGVIFLEAKGQDWIGGEALYVQAEFGNLFDVTD
jgi:hypothetical protein